jgi:serine/threonine protein kinase
MPGEGTSLNPAPRGAPRPLLQLAIRSRANVRSPPRVNSPNDGLPGAIRDASAFTDQGPRRKPPTIGTDRNDYMTPPHNLPAGQFLIESVRPLGEGGFGSVDEVRVTASNCPGKSVGSLWARKSLHERWNQVPQARSRFNREIQTLRTLEHPGIISFEGENVGNGERFYVMPVFQRTFRSWITDNPPLGNWRTVASIGVGLADALAHAHRSGFIHRDIKPENILYNGNGRPVISDWGLGYFFHQGSRVLTRLTVGGMGTEYYCAAEQWATGKCDGRGDVYSLGMMLDELVTGTRRSIQVGQGVRADSVNDIRARGFNDLIQAMTHPIAQLRPVMDDVRRQLRTIAG